MRSFLSDCCSSAWFLDVVAAGFVALPVLGSFADCCVLLPLLLFCVSDPSFLWCILECSAPCSPVVGSAGVGLGLACWRQTWVLVHFVAACMYGTSGCCASSSVGWIWCILRVLIFPALGSCFCCPRAGLLHIVLLLFGLLLFCLLRFPISLLFSFFLFCALCLAPACHFFAPLSFFLGPLFLWI